MGECFLAQIVERLRRCNLLLQKGTIVDSTLIAAPSSTKNEKGERDPEAHQAKKGNQWYFGYKEHTGVDAQSGLVHTVETTAANVHDRSMISSLLQGEETDIYGDSGYLGAENKEDAVHVNPNGETVQYHINRRSRSLQGQHLKPFRQKNTQSHQSAPR